jgi:oxygen-independent coproporphyrinogen-3 oxidase
MLTVGLGPGATGALPQGFVRNAAPGGWAAAIARGRLGTAGGLALDDDDRLRAAVVERLMCELAVDLAAMARAFRRAPAAFAVEKAALLALAAEGLVVLEGDRLRLTPQGRPALARVAAVFDRRPRTAVAAAAG